MPIIIRNDVHDQVWTRVKGLITVNKARIKNMANLLEDVYGPIRLNGSLTKTVGNIYGKNLLGKPYAKSLALYVYQDDFFLVDFTAKLKVSMYDMFERHPDHGTTLFWKLDEKHPTPLDIIRDSIYTLDDSCSHVWKHEDYSDEKTEAWREQQIKSIGEQQRALLESVS